MSVGVQATESRSERLAARRRERMMRRRRRAALLSVLMLVTVGWAWQMTRGDGATSRHGVAQASRQVLGDAVKSAASPAAPSYAAVSSPSPKSSSAVARGSFVWQGDAVLHVVPGSSRVYGTGPLRRFIVEVEGGLGEDAAAFTAFVENTLADGRSWGHDGAMSLQRVDSGRVAFRVVLASPRTVDRYCAPLDTNSYTSCYNSKGRAVLNQARWETGVPWYVNDMTTYRRYMINHEVGHALGHGHVACPRVGALAPTMMQQTLGMHGCRPNAWPYP